jgi:tetratricopeptide (TPR) repeat protein
MRDLGTLRVVVALVALVVASAAADFDDAVRAFERGERDRASTLFSEVASSDPRNPGAQYYIGLLQPDGDKAAERFQRAVNLAPNSMYAARSRLQLARYYLSRGLSLTAVKELTAPRADLTESEEAEALTVLVQAYLASGRPADALAVLDTSDTGRRNAPWLLLASGDALLARGDAVGAQKEYRRIVVGHASHPTVTLALVGSAEAAVRMGDVVAARDALVRLRARELPGYLTAEVDRIEARLGSPPDTTTTEAKFSVQVGVFSVKDNAERTRDGFVARGYPVRIVPRTDTEPTLYVVLVGAFATRDEAARAREKLEAEDDATYLVRPYR